MRKKLMVNALNLLDRQNDKNREFGIDKISHLLGVVWNNHQSGRSEFSF